MSGKVCVVPRPRQAPEVDTSAVFCVLAKLPDMGEGGTAAVCCILLSTADDGGFAEVLTMTETPPPAQAGAKMRQPVTIHGVVNGILALLSLGVIEHSVHTQALRFLWACGDYHPQLAMEICVLTDDLLGIDPPQATFQERARKWRNPQARWALKVVKGFDQPFGMGALGRRMRQAQARDWSILAQTILRRRRQAGEAQPLRLAA